MAAIICVTVSFGDICRGKSIGRIHATGRKKSEGLDVQSFALGYKNALPFLGLRQITKSRSDSETDPADSL
jgi:hypothetical protein